MRRPTHTNTRWDAARFEICAHRWVHVGEPGYGVGAGQRRHLRPRRDPPAARRRAGAQPTTVRLSLLRGPATPTRTADQGPHEFGYALVRGAEIADAVARGLPGEPAAARRRRGGRRPHRWSRSTDPAVVVEAVKLADDRSGDVVVRLYEALGGRARTRLTASFDFAAGAGL